ncbi:MAG: DUF1016 domain-containing protein [Deltaproteobacteria bacterium]|nr:MAG: DUF1016 domain-containing protein [Deltaproteobacteria bacterium]
MSETLPSVEGYGAFLEELKERIQQAQLRAALAVNSEMLLLYWQIGADLLQRQQVQGWGAKVVEQLSTDLRQAFPDMKGFSRTNLLYMRKFADTYSEQQIVQQAVGQIPWGHNVRLLDKVKDSDERLWYAQQTIEYGWSRDILVMQIDSGLYLREGKALTNFSQTLPKPQSDLAHQTLKDPYKFDFLSLGKEAQEREVEEALVHHIRDFLLELGKGFAFVGNQVHLEVGGEDYYVDLLFYHLHLRCFVVVELKSGKFLPEYAGKMSFYLSAVDHLMKHPDDQSSIGIILCRGKNQTVVEFALQDNSKPMGVAEYELTRALPAELQTSLPTIEQLELELSQESDEDES